MVYYCAALSRYIYKRKQPHTRFFLRLFERARPRIFFCKNSQREERGGVEATNNQRCRSHFFLLQPRAKLLPQERKLIKISSLFSKKIQFFSPPLELFSFVLHKNHSLKTQWLVLNKPLVNPPVRSNSRSFKCKIRCSFLVIVVVVKVVSFFFFVLSFYHRS